MARRASRAPQSRALGAALLALAACGGGGPQAGGVVTVSVEQPAMSAAEAEASLLTPIEAALGGVNDVYSLRGRAFEGGASVDVTFKRGVDSLTATHAVHEAIQAIQTSLPVEVDVPVVATRSPASVLARIGDQSQVYEQLRMELEPLPVADIQECGVRQARLLLELVPSKLMAMGVTIQDLVNALEAANVTIPGGMLTTGGSDPIQTTMRASGPGSTQDAIADTVVSVGDKTVRVRDVAVITQRSEAECLVEGAVDPKTPALLRISLRSPKDRALVVKELKKRKLVALAGAAAFTKPGHPRKVTLVTAPVGPVVEAVLVGDDADALADAGRTAMAALRSNAVVAAAWCEGCEKQVAEELTVDRDAAARFHISTWQSVAALRATLVGERVTTFTDGDQRGDVVIGIEEGGTRWAEMPIRADDGTMHTLADVLRVTKNEGPRDLLHVDRRRAVAVWVRGGAKTSASALTSAVKTVMSGARVRVVRPDRVDGEPW